MSSTDILFEELYARAERRDEVGSLESNLVQLAFLFRTNFEFRQLIRSSQVPIEDRVQAIVELPGFSTCQTFIELLFVIISETYFNQIQQVCDQYTVMVNERRNRSLIVIVTPVALTEAAKTDVGQSLQPLFPRPIALRNEVDPSLITGTLIRLPNGKIFDFSAKKQLSDFKSYLMENV
jgi:ATP synthase F1 delta subunit